MLTIRRKLQTQVTELAMDIQEQVKLTSNAQRGMNLNGIDGIEIKNI